MRQATVPAADLVLMNGKVLTVDARDTVSRPSRSPAAGLSRSARTRRFRDGSAARRETIDLRGRAATPELIDTHVHFGEASECSRCNLSDISVSTIDDVLQRVRAKVQVSGPANGCTAAAGMRQARRAPRHRASDLDKVAPDNPVWLEHTTGHYGVANSYA